MERLFSALSDYGFRSNKTGFREANAQWKLRGGRTKNPHTVDKIFDDDLRLFAEDTRWDLCEMFLALGRGKENKREVAELLPKLEPDYFIRRYESEELIPRLREQLTTLTRGVSSGYYLPNGDGWQISDSLDAAGRLLELVSEHIKSGCTDAQRIQIARLADAWLEAAHLAGTESTRAMRAVHRIGTCAIGTADECSTTAILRAMLAHSAPLDAALRPAVSGRTWHQPLRVFEDSEIELSLLKHDCSRATYLYGVRGQEDAFTVRQLVLDARLKLCSKAGSRTEDAQRSLARADELLHLTSDRTRAYFHLARHYYYSRRIAGEVTRSGLRRRQLDDIHLARRYYSAHFGSDANLYTASCDIRIAELSPSSVGREKLRDAVDVILAMPFDRCCVVDLSGTLSGSSTIYRRIPFQELTIAERAKRKRRAHA